MKLFPKMSDTTKMVSHVKWVKPFILGQFPFNVFMTWADLFNASGQMLHYTPVTHTKCGCRFVAIDKKKKSAIIRKYCFKKS